MSDGVIKILGEEIPFTNQSMLVDAIRYLPDNPRVYSLISVEERKLPYDELQEIIHQKMIQEENTKNLVGRIKFHGGLTEDIFVRADTNEVVEGNSRLAAYRLLQKEDPHKWKEIACKVVSTLTDEQQTSYLAELHIEGKKDWTPYEKANFIYRLVIEEEKNLEYAAKQIGKSPQEVKTLVKIIQLMNSNNDSERSNFSHYEVIVRNRAISSVWEGNPDLRILLLSGIKAEEKPFTALELRDKLPVVIAKPKILKKFTNREISLGDAFDAAKPSSILKRLKNAKNQLQGIFDSPPTLEARELGSCKIEAKRVRKELKRVDDFLSACEQRKNKGS